MKKRLLITSIVMMLVVAVALSTATYAWFTSNTTVKASSINITAGTSQSSALGIAWAASANTTFTPAFNNDYTTYVVAVDATTNQAGGFQPAAPASLTDAAPTFHTAYIDAQGLFKSTPGETTTDVYRFANNANSSAEGFSNVIHIANLAQNGSVNVTLTAQITPTLTAITESEVVDTTNYYYFDANKILIDAPTGSVSTGYKASKTTTNTAVDFVRIAVFEVSGATYTYKGVLSNSGNGTDKDTAVGTITSGNSAAALVSTTGIASTTSINLGSLAAQADKGYAIYVWLDGALFDEARGGQSCSVALTFASV